MRVKSCLVVICCSLLAFGAVVCGALPARADDFGGNDSDLADTKCNSFRAYTYLCTGSGEVQTSFELDTSSVVVGNVPIPVRIGTGDGSGGGGASWHLYSLSSGKQPHCTGTSAMTCDVTYETIQNTCGNGDGYYKFFLSYGWEGPRIASNPHSTEYGYEASAAKQYGPVAIDSAGISYARYNNSINTGVNADGIKYLDDILNVSRRKILISEINKRGGEVQLTFNAAVRLRDKILELGSYKAGTGYYCVPEIIDPTEVKAGTKVEWGESSSRSTGVLAVSKTAAPSDGEVDLTVRTNQEAALVFKHYVTASESINGVGYKIKYDTDAPAFATITPEDLNGELEYEGNFTEEYNGEYVMPNGPSGDSKRMVKKNTVKVAFSKEGIYRVCGLTSAPTNGPDNLDTRNPIEAWVCVSVKVEPEEQVEYKARSIVTVGGETAVDTGIVGAYVTMSDKVVNASVGDTLNIAFSHSAYASKSTRNVALSVPFVPNRNTGYIINYRMANGVSKNVGVTLSRNANLTSKVATSLYSTASPDIDQYNVTFSSPGNYVFCETFSVKNNNFTNVCVRVRVSGSGGGSGTLMAMSTVTGDGNSTSTGRVFGATSKTLDLGARNQNENVTIAFEHDGWVSSKMNVDYTVSSMSGLDGRAEIVGTPTRVGNSSGTKSMRSAVTVDGGRYYTTSSGSRLYSYTATVRLKEPGSYTFCQTLKMGKSGESQAEMTTVCVTMQVASSASSACDSSNPNRTTVTSRVANIRIDANTYSELVYAKPGDTVRWSECYYAGVQNSAFEMVTKTHAEHSMYPATDPSANDNQPISSVVSWGNGYSVRWPDGASSGESFNIGAAVTDISSHDVSITSEYVGRTISDGITSSSPISVSFNNEGKHSWPCRPGPDQTGADAGCPGREPVYYCDSGRLSGTQCVYETSATPLPASDDDDDEDDEDDDDEKVIAYTCDYANGWFGPYGSGEYSYCVKSVGAPYRCERYDGGYGHDYYQNPDCSHSNDYITHSEESGPAIASSSVQIPYNYMLTAGAEIDGDKIFAGEVMTLSSGWVNVEKKYNNLTKYSYATIVPNAKAQLISFVSTYDRTGSGSVVTGNSNLCVAVYGSSRCETLAEDNNLTLNSNGDLEGETRHGVFGGQYNAFDVSAGNYICFAVGVYPYTSGADNNLNNLNGDGNWYLSNASCKIVAKKPTFGVYGAGLYSVSNINALNASKRNLYPNYVSQGAGDAMVFGSFVEQNLVLRGTTNTVASGGATIGGSKELDGGFCKYRTPLSFANYGLTGVICGAAYNGKVGEMLGSSTAGLGATKSRANYVDYLLPADTMANIESGNIVNLNSDYKVLSKNSNSNIRYSVSNGSMRLLGGTIEPGVTHIVKSKSGDVTIAGDIYYADASYKTISEIPKLIIYAKNITIDCSVKEVDAILIATGKINTCNSGDANARERSNPLVIRGMTISDGLILGRTYGAGPGEFSDVPAEVINYDTSATLWSRFISGTGETGKFTVVYQHELAPRY